MIQEIIEKEEGSPEPNKTAAERVRNKAAVIKRKSRSPERETDREHYVSAGGCPWVMMNNLNLSMDNKENLSPQRKVMRSAVKQKASVQRPVCQLPPKLKEIEKITQIYSGLLNPGENLLA